MKVSCDAQQKAQKGNNAKSHQVKWFIKYSRCPKAKAKMNSNIENILLSPALVFQAGTIDLELLDRGLGEESRNFDENS